jgi:periplasmic divalent cation tolerance protein
MFPGRSMYRWKGRLEDQDEVVLVVKTRDSLAKKTEQEVAKVHSYEVPCIIRIKGTANTPFDKWLNKETGKAT